LGEDPGLSRLTLLPASFWEVFVKAARGNEGLPSSLKKLEVRVRDGLKRAYMGVFVGGNHEIAVCIDFEHENIKYGQCHHISHAMLPLKVLQATHWLEIILHQPPSLRMC
jgi:hypothetical protein